MMIPTIMALKPTRKAPTVSFTVRMRLPMAKPPATAVPLNAAQISTLKESAAPMISRKPWLPAPRLPRPSTYSPTTKASIRAPIGSRALYHWLLIPSGGSRLASSLSNRGVAPSRSTLPSSRLRRSAAYMGPKSRPV